MAVNWTAPVGMTTAPTWGGGMDSSISNSGIIDPGMSTVYPTAFDWTSGNYYDPSAIAAPGYSYQAYTPQDTTNYGGYGVNQQIPTLEQAGYNTGGDYGQGNFVAGDVTDPAAQGGGFLDSLWKSFSALPLDRQVGMGASLLGGLGNYAAMLKQQKLAKWAQKRAKTNAAIADRYNNSYDVTTPQQSRYAPLDPSAYSNYGQHAGTPQQVFTTPGTTTRVQLAGGGLPYGGQADTVPAMLSPGEYVMDADTVAALGDGNTQAGAGALDQMRQEIRKHKRSAPVDRIPPKAKPAKAYLKGKNCG